MFIYTCGAISDRGDVRKENQDSILFRLGEEKRQEAALFVVADGMGGLSYGAQTSQYITGQFGQWWETQLPLIVQDGMDREEDIQELLEQEIWDINQAILAFNQQMNCRSGSTLSLLFLYKNKYFIENLGDSRVYLVRNKTLCQITQDQSLAAQMIQKHHLSEEEAKRSVPKNKLTMCVGMFAVPKSNYYTGEMCAGDCFLLCSDGFYQPLKTGQMKKVLEEAEFNAVEKAEYLRQFIETGKAADNVSAIVVEVKEGNRDENKYFDFLGSSGRCLGSGHGSAYP